MPIENVVLVTVDSLRADACRSAGGPGGMEFVPGLVESGVSFDRAFASGPGTSPSFPGVLCGTHALSYGGLGPLSSDRPRLAEYLSNAGLSTAGFHCNPFLSRFFEYDRGFDQFRDYQNPLMGVATKVFPRGIELGNSWLGWLDDSLDVTGALRKAYSFVSGRPRPYVRGEVITDDTLDWLDTVDAPFFCWTHYMDVHHPCHPPEPYRREFGVADVTHEEVATWYSELIESTAPASHGRLDSLVALYRASIRYISDQIERLIAFLREREVFSETLVVVTSDHGELHGEYGAFGKPARLYDELLHVPLIVANGPDTLRQARADLVSLLDVPPLIHDALGLPVPDRYEGRIPGVDSPRDHVLAEHEVDGEVVVGARSDEWLYEVDNVRNERRLFRAQNGQLEPAEIDGEPEALRLREVVSKRLAQLDIEACQLEETVGGDVESRLEDLGYL